MNYLIHFPPLVCFLSTPFTFPKPNVPLITKRVGSAKLDLDWL